MNSKLLTTIIERLERAREKHPEGCTMLDLLDEVSEARYAQKNESYEAYQSELLDVIVVAIRLIQKEQEFHGKG